MMNQRTNAAKTISFALVYQLVITSYLYCYQHTPMVVACVVPLIVCSCIFISFFNIQFMVFNLWLFTLFFCCFLRRPLLQLMEVGQILGEIIDRVMRWMIIGEIMLLNIILIHFLLIALDNNSDQ
ncbi:hypothetical protein RJT34_15189 [Clitoria ternatea]|uniref:Uncharacterized protein n=1 Tax=Clitoria ternatea TaxID=43366 RepID=A0AAN9JTN7_CLITE